MRIDLKKVIQSNYLGQEALQHLENYWKGQNFITWLVFGDDAVSRFLLRNGIESGEVVILYHF